MWTHTKKLISKLNGVQQIAIGLLTLGISGLIKGPIPYLPILGLEEFHRSISPELFGIGLTVLLIDSANKRLRIAERKRELILQMASPHNAIAIEAARIIQSEDWHLDGTLKNGDFRDADLRNLILRHAYLAGSLFVMANLKQAILEGANLSFGVFSYADLYGLYAPNANLFHANLQFVNLEAANLKGADLRECLLRQCWLRNCNLRDSDLRSAVMIDADLRGALIERAKVDETTVLPDGTRWTNTTDLTKFTNPTHKDFWRSPNRHSPAHDAEKHYPARFVAMRDLMSKLEVLEKEIKTIKDDVNSLKSNQPGRHWWQVFWK